MLLIDLLKCHNKILWKYVCRRVDFSRAWGYIYIKNWKDKYPHNVSEGDYRVIHHASVLACVAWFMATLSVLKHMHIMIV